MSNNDNNDEPKITFTCKVVDLGKRWQCTSKDGTKTWFAGPDYRYKGKLASEDEVEPSPSPSPPPPPPPSTGVIVEDGIKMLYPKIGDAQKFVFKSGNAGRSQYVCRLKKPLISMEISGIIELKKVDNTGEEVSIKTRGGPHGDSDPSQGSCYISGVGYDGSVNNQYEQPHPKNHAMSLHGKAGKFNPGSVVGKKFAIKNIVYYDKSQDKDIIKVYLDMGLNNDWKLFFETTSTQFKNKENSKGEPMVFFRMDDIPGAPQSDENAKLTKGTVREIDPASTPTPPTPPPSPTTPTEGAWSWNLSKVRNFSGAGNKDPQDSKVSLQGSSDIKIDNDIATVSGSPRIHVQSDLLNVEISADVDSKTDVKMRTRSEHARDNDPWRWGYSVGFDMGAGDVSIKKEGIHPVYTPRIKSVDVTYKAGFNKLANRTYDVPEGVRIEGWLNDKKVIEVIDSGNWKEWDKVDSAELEDMKKYNYTFERMQKPIRVVDTHYIRFDNVTNAKIRSLNIRPISPNP